jgi:hypothetical protein
VKYYGIGKPLQLFFITYTVAAIIILAIFYFTKKSFRGTAYIIPLLPVLASLAYIGASGIVCAAFIFGFFLLFRQPLSELFKMNGLLNIYKNIIIPYKSYLPFLYIFTGAFAILIIFTSVKLFYFLLVFIVAILLFFVSCKTIPVMFRKRFNPVLIINRRSVEYNFSYYMIPFFISAFFAMFFTPYVSTAYISDDRFETFINEEDYYSHLLFQSTFSTRQLNTSNNYYPFFIIDKDGLPLPDEQQYINQTVNYSEYPEFPLKDLMMFFNDVNNGERTDNTGNIERITDILAIIILLSLILPCIFIKRDKKLQNINFSNLKKIEVKHRFNNFCRNKSYGYKSKSSIRLQKDA